MREIASVALLLALAGGATAAEQKPADPCAEAPGSYECLVANLPAFYQSDPQRFFDVFYAQARKAQACETPADAVLFLRIHGSTGVDGEIAEAVSEETEKLALQKPACLLRAAAKLSSAELDRLALYLRNPLLNSSESIAAKLASVNDVSTDNPLLVRLRAK
jgi:hypothetical protein